MCIRDRYIDHVPDADLQMLLEVNKKGFDLFNELPVGDRLDYTISYEDVYKRQGVASAEAGYLIGDWILGKNKKKGKESDCLLYTSKFCAFARFRHRRSGAAKNIVNHCFIEN